MLEKCCPSPTSAACRLAVSLAVALGVSLPALARAQSETELWMSAAVRYEPVEDLRLSLAQEVRFDKDISRVGRVQPEFNADYDLPLGFRVGAGYRFIADRRSEGDFRYGHRVHIDGRFSRDVSVLEFGYRLRGQQTMIERAGHNTVMRELRNRFSIDLEVHDVVVPEVSAEFFTPLGPVNEPAAYRLAAGVGFDITKHHALDVGYHFQRDFLAKPDDTHVFSVGYRFDI